MDVKDLIGRLIDHVPQVRPAAIHVYDFIGRLTARLRPTRSSWKRPHPFDRLHRINTSGFVPNFLLNPGSVLTIPYAAAQPSIIRTALAAIPEPQRCHFLDIGCGKGRPLFVALEFQFAHITGIERSPTLAAIARRNVRKAASQPVNIITADVLTYPLPPDDLAIFLYNPLDEILMARLIAMIQSSLLATPRDLYIIYCNPVCADLFDASPLFERRFARQLPYDVSEADFGQDQSDGVVIWQNRGNLHDVPPGRHDAAVVVTMPGYRAEVK